MYLASIKIPPNQVVALGKKRGESVAGWVERAKAAEKVKKAAEEGSGGVAGNNASREDRDVGDTGSASPKNNGDSKPAQNAEVNGRKVVKSTAKPNSEAIANGTGASVQEPILTHAGPILTLSAETLDVLQEDHQLPYHQLPYWFRGSNGQVVGAWMVVLLEGAEPQTESTTALKLFRRACKQQLNVVAPMKKTKVPKSKTKVSKSKTKARKKHAT